MMYFRFARDVNTPYRTHAIHLQDLMSDSILKQVLGCEQTKEIVST